MNQSSPAPLVLEDPGRVGLLAAELVVNRLCARPHARLLLPTGRSPQGMYAALRAHAAAGRLPSGGAAVLQLDEYVGIAQTDPQSFAAQLRAALAGVTLALLATIDGAAADVAAEAERHEALVEAAPIDLAVLGLGRDSHVAFDEPPARLASGVRRVTLAQQIRGRARRRRVIVDAGEVWWFELPRVGRKPGIVCSRRAVNLRMMPVIARITTVGRERALPTAIPIAGGELDGLPDGGIILAHDLFLAGPAAPALAPAGRLSALRLVELREALAWTFSIRR